MNKRQSFWAWFLVMSIVILSAMAGFRMAEWYEITEATSPPVLAIPTMTMTFSPSTATHVQPTATPTMALPTVTATPIPPKVIITPTGMVCEIEQQWGRGPGHDYEYGCFAISCWFADGSTYGNNLACVDRSIGTPWPYEWFFYHPLMGTLNEEAK